jgi:hypothetical protein
MRLFDESALWLQHLSITEDGIVASHNGRFGLGAVLLLEYQQSRRLLMVKKSYRPGFEGNDQFAFPGGMIRSHGPTASLNSMIWTSLAARVAAEVSFALQPTTPLIPQERQPPVVAAYHAKGRRRHTVLLPFALSVSGTFTPATQDTTVYAARWQEPITCWAEITPTNRLLAAYYLWPRLSEAEQMSAKPSVEDALHQATAWAREVGLPAPAVPWAEVQERTNRGEKGSTLANHRHQPDRSPRAVSTEPEKTRLGCGG